MIANNAGPGAAATATKAPSNTVNQDNTPDTPKNQVQTGISPGEPGCANTNGGLNLDEIMVSVVSNAKSTETKHYRLSQVLRSIKHGPFGDQVAKIRRIFRETLAARGLKAAKSAIKFLKEQLPGAMFSGTFSVRNAAGLTEHSGVLCCDLDELGDRLPGLRHDIEQDEHVIALFVSPSGDGLKILIRILADPVQHKQSFVAAQLHFRTAYDVELDQSGSDVCRLCFLTFDPEMKINPHATVLLPAAQGTDETQHIKAAKPTDTKKKVSAKKAAVEGAYIHTAPFFPRLLEQALAAIPADDYALWIETGLALRNWDDSTGLAFWDWWSQTSTKYVEGECEQKWETFDPEHEPKVTYGTIFRRAREHGWNQDESVLDGLATLEGLDRERWIENCADWLGVKTKALKDALAKRPSGEAIRGYSGMVPVEPWPEPVDGAKLFDEIVGCLLRFVHLPVGAAEAITLWIVHSFCFTLRYFSPRLHVASPQKRCGKSLLLSVLTKLVNKPLFTTDISPAALFRIIDKAQPTLLIDEFDSAAHGDKAEALRNVLNSGFTATGATIRLVGDDHEAVAFKTFAPTVISGIGDVPDTVADRSITIKMQRKLPGEQVERSRKFDGLELRRKITRWIQDHGDQIRDADPEIPNELNYRQGDVWDCPFAIADVAGGDWPAMARTIALNMSSGEDAETLVQILLADIRAIFEDKETDRIRTGELLDALNAMTDRLWPTICKGAEMNAHKLSRLLRDFGIAPGTVRFSRSTAKGYTQEQFEDAWARYLQPIQEDTVNLQIALGRGGDVEDMPLNNGTSSQAR